MESNLFLKPEKPFLVHYEDNNGNGGWSWFKTEDELLASVKEYKEVYNLTICDVVEIVGLREIEID